MKESQDGFENYLRAMKELGFEPRLNREQFIAAMKEKNIDAYCEEAQAMVRNPIHTSKAPKK
ncbi:hypothetical protein G6726_05745 [Polynucleobacter paneuropaeus]|jgi:phosphosulfolactate synthase (CoM biosynthesis protein A)|nr:hypothetical protein G6726_05745 [Polynucleobacter paneuropaeus]